MESTKKPATEGASPAAGPQCYICKKEIAGQDAIQYAIGVYAHPTCILDRQKSGAEGASSPEPRSTSVNWPATSHIVDSIAKARVDESKILRDEPEPEPPIGSAESKRIARDFYRRHNSETIVPDRVPVFDPALVQPPAPGPQKPADYKRELWARYSQDGWTGDATCIGEEHFYTALDAFASREVEHVQADLSRAIVTNQALNRRNREAEAAAAQARKDAAEWVHKYCMIEGEDGIFTFGHTYTVEQIAAAIEKAGGEFFPAPTPGAPRIEAPGP